MNGLFTPWPPRPGHGSLESGTRRYSSPSRRHARSAPSASNSSGDRRNRCPPRVSTNSASTARVSGSTTCHATCCAPGRSRRMIDQDAVVGVTSNPTIFQRALADLVRLRRTAHRARRRAEPEGAVRATRRPRRHRGLRAALPVWERTAGRDGWVSIEVDPRLAYDAPATIEEAERLHRLIDRPNLFVKIAATEAGLVAIEEMIARGRSINVTLIFSLQRYAEVVESYLRGLERLIDAGGDPSSVWSVASFFVSRVDTETTSGSTSSAAPTSSRESWRSPMPSSPIVTTGRPSPASSGRRWRAKAPMPSAACGLRPR